MTQYMRVWLFWSVLLLFFAAPVTSPHAQEIQVITYNRSGNMLEGAPPVGKPFYVSGLLFSEERTVRLYYAKAIDKGCPLLNQQKNACPAGERDGQWACQEWRRIRNDRTRRFRVLVPRLRSSFSRYCFRVAFYESLGETLTQGLVSQLFTNVRKAIHREWSPRLPLAPRSSRSASKDQRLRQLRYLTGHAPNKAGTTLLRSLVKQEVQRFLQTSLSRYTSAVKTNQTKGSLKNFLLEKTFKYGLAYLRQQSTSRRYYHLSRFTILNLDVLKMVSSFVTDLQKSSQTGIKQELSRSPYIGPEKTLDGALTKKLNRAKTLNLSRLTKLLQPKQQPTWSNDWARYLKQACELVERLHIQRRGYTRYRSWKQALLAGKSAKQPKNTSTELRELQRLSCYRFGKTRVVSLQHSEQHVASNQAHLSSLFLRASERINLFRYVQRLLQVTRLHRSFRLFKEQLKKTETAVTDSIGGYLTSVTIRQSNLSSPLALSAKQYFFNYLSIDVGFAGALLPGFNDLQTKIFPYVGIHVYFAPVSSSTSLQLEDSFLRRFSLFVGITVLPFDLQNNSIYVVGAMEGLSPIMGFGFRMTDFIRVNLGAVLYINRSLDILNRDEADRLAVTGFVSISIDANLFELVGSAVTRSRNVVKATTKQ